MGGAMKPVHVIAQHDMIRFVLKLFGLPVGSIKLVEQHTQAVVSPLPYRPNK
jgi:hypothetical protein